MITITSSAPGSYSWLGTALTILLIGIGIYVGIKHHKDPGFWFGVLALILITSSIVIY